MNKIDIKQYDPAKEYYFTEGCFINELWNTIEDQSLSVAQARVTPGKTTKWHKLKGIAERYIILEGCGRVEIGSHPPAIVKTGDVVAIPPDTPQRISNTGLNDLLFLAVCTPRFNEQAYQEIDTQ